MEEEGWYLFDCPHCGDEIPTPDGVRVKHGDTIIGMCPLCGQALVFLHLPRDEDFIRSFALDTEIMADEDFSSEEIRQYIEYEVMKYLDESGFVDLYFAAIARAAQDFGSGDSEFDFADDESDPLPDSSALFNGNTPIAPTRAELGLE